MTLQSSPSDDQGGSNINREGKLGHQIDQSITTPILGLEYWVGQMKPKLELMER